MVEKQHKIEQPSEPTESEQFGEIAHGRHEAISSLHEQEEHRTNQRQSEREIIAEAKQLAKSSENTKSSEENITPAKRRNAPLNKKQLDNSFNTQMKYAEAEMNGNERLLSKLIHVKPIEKTSDFLGSTVARSNAMLSGSIAAFVSVTVLYFVSKYFGYELSGFETIAGFIVGWVLGIVYDYVVVMVRGSNK